ncbi:GNAT family N-acetyltransferase [Radiobacillus kanasensis]|uniref:GNAT family N-acetyltransferase n=1 Tax=Radiobacillus kanasensis TaxID=2844358 RepID=UPI001E6423AD|nr:GNAT family N-acetyltransferase [Radiobacillus kanasensis]UFT98452.1 GNAT family N-acetyltransferase [Radiobacillus kanasensis]
MQETLQVRKLTLTDFDMVSQMKTSVEDDYVLHIYENLVTEEHHGLYGLFEGSNLLSIAGYSIFPGGYAMLGRLRSDTRILAKGNATAILRGIMNELERDPSIKWIGANTNLNNLGARRVLAKLGLEETTTLHSVVIQDTSRIKVTPGPIWTKVEDNQSKRDLLFSLKENALHVYPYECYYPFPLSEGLIDEENLEQTVVYQNPEHSRFVMIKKDRKGDWYAQIKYFWNDHYEQSGFWETVFHHLEQEPNDIGLWLDFSEIGYERIPDKSAFEEADPWVLYGQWTEKR